MEILKKTIALSCGKLLFEGKWLVIDMLAYTRQRKTETERKRKRAQSANQGQTLKTYNARKTPQCRTAKTKRPARCRVRLFVVGKAVSGPYLRAVSPTIRHKESNAYSLGSNTKAVELAGLS